jgi:hypothetical protein
MNDRPLLYHVHHNHDRPLLALIQSWMGPKYASMEDGCSAFYKTVWWSGQVGEWVVKLRFMRIPRGNEVTERRALRG